MLFGKWDYRDEEISTSDKVFMDHIAFTSTKSQVFLPHTAGRYQVKKFRKTQCPIVERLVDALMFNGRNTGKKLKACLIV
jgi:small subunit ribosomal protein S5e